MAYKRLVDLKKDEDCIALKKDFSKAFQSARINFLIGSGGSYPAIQTGGNIEKEIEDSLDEGNTEKANNKMFEFLVGVQKPTNDLIKNTENEKNSIVISNYARFLQNIEKILIDRDDTLLPKRANIFTTNYDLYIEKAADDVSILRLNDGFLRTPSLSNRYHFSPQNFFVSTQNIGASYSYAFEIPVVNLIKIHGSLSWRKDTDEILCEFGQREIPQSPSNEDVIAYNEEFAVVLPQKAKFRQTLLDRYYYDLLRIYSNELDNQNTLLVVFGFSFEDEHILEITKRALKNPSLKMIIMCHKADRVDGYMGKFNGFNNVEVVAPKDDQIDLTTFNNFLMSVT